MTEPVYKRAKLPFPDRQTFVERFTRHVTRGGIFLPGGEPKPKGTVVRFELTLRDGTPVLRGEGTVIWARGKDEADPRKAYGMALKFTRLDRESRALVLEMVERKERAAGGRAEAGDAEASGATPAASPPEASPGSAALSEPQREEPEPDEPEPELEGAEPELEGAEPEPVAKPEPAVEPELELEGAEAEPLAPDVDEEPRTEELKAEELEPVEVQPSPAASSRPSAGAQPMPRPPPVPRPRDSAPPGLYALETAGADGRVTPAERFWAEQISRPGELSEASPEDGELDVPEVEFDLDLQLDLSELEDE